MTFAFYDAVNNILFILDSEHPVVEEAAIKINENYNCIIDFVSRNQLKEKIYESTCRYKCWVMF